MIRTAVVKPSFAPSMKASYTFIFFLIPATMNPTMMDSSRMEATEMLTLSTIIALSCMKPHTTAAMKAHTPPRVSSNVRLNRFIFWYSDVMMTPASVATVVASSMGMNTSVGCAAPCCARYERIDTGMMVSPDVFSTRNIIIGFVAVSFFVFSSCICSIAFSPSGVAALSSPSMFAEMFMKMEPVAGCPFGISGNSLVNTGDSTRANRFTMPARSPIFMMPSHSASIPVSPNEISKAFFDVSKVESIMAGNTLTSPMKISLHSPTTKAMTKKAIQI